MAKYDPATKKYVLDDGTTVPSKEMTKLVNIFEFNNRKEEISDMYSSIFRKDIDESLLSTITKKYIEKLNNEIHESDICYETIRSIIKED